MSLYLQKEIKISYAYVNEFISERIKFISDFIKKIKPIEEEFLIRPVFTDGSKKLFWRIILPYTQTSFILMENAPVDAFALRENKAYVLIGQHLFQQGCPAPEILNFNLQNGIFILEDLGDNSLHKATLPTENKLEMYRAVVEILVDMQLRAVEGFDLRWTCQTEYYDAFVMRHYEVEYFKKAFLHGFLGLKKEWPELESGFDHLIAQALKGIAARVFLHRDFQPRNIMIRNGKPRIIDWQGGRIGPPGYDLASLLIESDVHLGPEEQSQIYFYYLKLLEMKKPEWVSLFENTFPYLAVLRNLQILGAFAFLSRGRGKMIFTLYIPRALRSLRYLLAKLRDPALLPLQELLDDLESNRNS